MTWQLIETAPKEKARDVLLWCGGARIGSWWPEWDYDPLRIGNKDCWVIYGGYIVKPTHWQLIPDPPSDTEARS